MSTDLTVLTVTAASIGFFHTLLGPDHYLPFIVMAKSGAWSLRKTAMVTVLCGMGHVLSSVVLGILGVALGVAVTKLETLEAVRGNLAAWALIAFGLVYFIWGVRNAIRNKPHTHIHHHEEGESHAHLHVHHDDHLHAHVKEGKKNFSPWVLFVIFILGPCEPLIPLLMYPAAKSSYFDLTVVTLVFAVVTISTMLMIVLVSTFGINLLPMEKMERYSHALAGAAILLSGLAIQFLGL